MSSPHQQESAPTGFDSQGWPLPEVRSMMVDNFVRSWTQHWLAVGLLFVVSMGLVLFAAWLVTPTWEGQATMEIQPAPSPNPLGTSSALTQVAPLTASQLVKNLIEQTHSLNFLREVVIESKLDGHYKDNAETPPDARTKIKKAIAYVALLQFLRRDTGVDYVAKALDDLGSSWLSITPTEGSTVIPIYVYGDTPVITKKVGDTIMDLLQARADAALRSGVQQQIDVVSKLVSDAESKVKANDAAMETARMKFQFFDPQSYAQQVQDAKQNLVNEKTTFLAQVDSLNARIAGLAEQLDKIPEVRKMMAEGTTTSADNLLSSRIANDIADTKAEIAQKTSTQGPNSPTVRSLEVKLAAQEQSLADAKRDESKTPTDRNNTNEQLDPKYNSIFNSWIDATMQLKGLQARFEALDQAIAALTDMQHDAIKADIELRRMQRDAGTDEDQLKSLTTQLRQLNNLIATPRLFAGVVSRSNTSVLNEKKNDYPNMLLAIGLALAIGLFAGLVLPIAYDYLNQTLLTSRQVASIPGVRVVASVPRVSSSKMFASV